MTGSAAAALLLLHGFTGDSTTWGEFARAWAAVGGEESASLLALDLPGHGLAPGLPSYSLERVAEIVLEEAPAPCHILGYSMGGRVALRAALLAPDRVLSLVLVGTSPGIADPAARAQRVAADEALALRLETEPFEDWVDSWLAQPLFASQAKLGPNVRAEGRSQRLRNRPDELARVLRGMGTGAMSPLWDRLATLPVPTLLVAGEADAKFTALAYDVAARMPRASVAVVPGVGHAVQLEAPAALAALVRDWLRATDEVPRML